LLTGATGLIGSAVLAQLMREGQEVVAVMRPGGRRKASAGLRWVALDIASAADAGDWLPHLQGIDAVVNCAGVLQDSPRDSTAGVHVAGAATLFAACEQAGVRRVVHVSATGVDRGGSTPFARSKLAGDQALTARDLDWVILRPSVVVGRAAYGGSALLRGLSALPLLPRMPDAGLLQIVQLDDVVRTVLHFLEPKAPTRIALELVGPEPLSFEDTVLAYRRWLGWGEARCVPQPRWLARAVSAIADAAGWLGWRTPMRSTARIELARGATGDGSAWRHITGIAPLSLAEALAGEPASVQERWFARLYLLKPLVLGALALLWAGTGVVALGPGWAEGMRLMAECGLAGVRPAGVIAGAAADIGIGLAIAFRRTARAGLLAAAGVTLLYLVLGTVLLPRLWLEPLGPLLKAVPILALNLVAPAILEER
jgi:uncharacterized protein YbjT (DUF2867 family)